MADWPWSDSVHAAAAATFIAVSDLYFSRTGLDVGRIQDLVANSALYTLSTVVFIFL
jgi:hypothetical protein